MDDLRVTVAHALRSVSERIDRACALAGRARGSVRLVAVSKFHDVAAIRAAYDAGHRLFGENYVQELRAKAKALEHCEGIEWHMIGHVQRNKARDVAAIAAMVHTVDSVRLATALDRYCAELGRVLPVLIQVNVGGEAQKSGCAPSEVRTVLERIASMKHLAVKGLMTIPPATENVAESRRFFDALSKLRDELGGPEVLPELSMGMTADLEFAIAAGATIVRVGTAIFGVRPTAPH
jgi:pyridoxal phosphate enzyme (YggS family)